MSREIFTHDLPEGRDFTGWIARSGGDGAPLVRVVVTSEEAQVFQVQTGQRVLGAQSVQKTLVQAFNKEKMDQPIVVVGYLTSLAEDGARDPKLVTEPLRRGEPVLGKLLFLAHDFMALRAFNGQTQPQKLSARHKILAKLLLHCNSSARIALTLKFTTAIFQQLITKLLQSQAWDSCVLTEDSARAKPDEVQLLWLVEDRLRVTQLARSQSGEIAQVQAETSTGQRVWFSLKSVSDATRAGLEELAKSQSQIDLVAKLHYQKGVLTDAHLSQFEPHKQTVD